MKTKLSETVDWQGVSEYTTRHGKAKEIMTGIPKSGFWTLWKRSKDELKALGVTLQAGKAERTGEFYVRDGIRHERTRKSWEVVLWINPRNRELAEELDNPAWRDSDAELSPVTELQPF